MSFQFPETASERVDFVVALAEEKIFPLEYLQQLGVIRQRMCDTLSTQPNSQALLDAIETYLPHALRVAQSLDGKKSTLKFSWRSVLSMGTRLSLKGSSVERPMVKSTSPWFEVTYLMLAYGFTLSNMATKRISSASETSANEAVDMLARAAGVFASIAGGIAPQWREPPPDKLSLLGGPSSEKPPECSVQVLYLLSEQALADAQAAALCKAEKRGMSEGTLSKLSVMVWRAKEQCVALLSRVAKRDQGELSELFRSYVKQGARLAEGLAMKRFAMQQHEAEEDGQAVAAITHAYSIFVEISTGSSGERPYGPFREQAAGLIGETSSLMDKMTRSNNMISYKKVPPINEVQGAMPSIGRSIVETKPFTLPEAPPLDTPS